MFEETYSLRRVLVTGHNGFKGSWLTHWLCRLGANVTGISLPSDERPSLFESLDLKRRIVHHEVDIRDRERLRTVIHDARPEIVFHLAAQAIVRSSYADPAGTFHTNVGGTVNVLESIRDTNGVRACVVVTSDKCYENREWPFGYRECDRLGGHDPYSASKGAAELVVASYRDSFFRDPNATRIATARAGNVIGGGDWAPDRLVPDFVRSITANRPLVLRNPTAIRPWQHVLEPLSGYLLLGALLCRDIGRRYAESWNFGPPDPSVVEVEELARLFCRYWGGGEVHVQRNENQPHEANLLKLDCGKARQLLGWSATWGLADTAKYTVDWYKAFRGQADMVCLTNQQIEDYCRAALEKRSSWMTSNQSCERISSTARAA